MNEHADSLRNLADLIRVVWMKERRLHEEALTGKPHKYALSDSLPRYDGGEDLEGRRTDPWWPKVAQYVIANDLNPRHWVRYVLKNFQPARGRDRRRFATPTSLTSEKIREKFMEYQVDLPRRLQVELDIQSRASALRFRELRRSKASPRTDAEALRFMLLDTSLSLSALFRYCAAVGGGLDDVAAEFFEPALWQYFFDRELYDSIWEGYIPDSLRQAAAAARTSFFEAREGSTNG
jgi:hypothetical protein